MMGGTQYRLMIMKRDSSGQISRLLTAWSDGEQQALDQLMPQVYQQLRAMAARQLRDERPNHSLQVTGLVHEAFMKLVQQEGVQWTNRSHFYAVASTAMRRILVDYARRRRAGKRGGGAEEISLDHVQLAVNPAVDLIDLEDCLARLEELDPQQAKVVELRYFAGCTLEEVAEVLQISPSTVQREWRFAKAWLRAELERPGGEGT